MGRDYFHNDLRQAEKTREQCTNRRQITDRRVVHRALNSQSIAAGTSTIKDYGRCRVKASLSVEF